MTPELARQILALELPQTVKKRHELLAQKCNEGSLSTDERKELEHLVTFATLLMTLQSKARTFLKEQRS